MFQIGLDAYSSNSSVLPERRQVELPEDGENSGTAKSGIQEGEEQVNASVVTISPQAAKLNLSSVSYFGESVVNVSKVGEVATRLFMTGVLTEEEFTVLAGREAETKHNNGVIGESISMIDTAIQHVKHQHDTSHSDSVLRRVKSVLENFMEYGEAIKNPDAFSSMQSFNQAMAEVPDQTSDVVYTNTQTLLKMADSLSSSNHSSTSVKRYLEVLNQ